LWIILNRLELALAVNAPSLVFMCFVIIDFVTKSIKLYLFILIDIVTKSKAGFLCC